MSAFDDSKELPEVDHVEYLGESIRMVKSAEAVADFQDYPYVIAPAEVKRVRELVIRAPIANEFPNRENLFRGIWQLRFRGYGMQSFAEKLQPDGSVLSGWGIEVPPGDQMRILIFRGRHGQYRLLDDFINATEPQEIMSVVEESGQLIYSAMNGERVLTRPITSK